MSKISVKRACVILAAGQGTRMKSPLPKVLHRVGGRTLLDRAIDAAQDLGCERIIVIVGRHSQAVIDAATLRVGLDNIAFQDDPKGTAHAVLAAKDALCDFEGRVIISYADCPLMSAEVLRPVFELAQDEDMAVMAFEARHAGHYGRMIIKDKNNLKAIVEAKEATKDQLKINICNSGVLACEASLLFSLLDEVGNDNAKGEYYLTDIVALARARDLKPKVVMGNEDDVGGVNSQAELSMMEQIWQSRTRHYFMDKGVTMSAPHSVYFSWDTQIEAGAVIEPNVVIGGGVKIAANAVIRAFSHLEGCDVGEGALIGPYARLRPGAVIGKSAHIGNFVEVKNVIVGDGAKANHLSYLGDGEIGAKANIGAGTIFCNYDGFFKYKTKIGAGAFIGSNSALVAPVSIGDGVIIGSGSVITRDVSNDALGLARSEQIEKPQWAAKFRERKSAEKAKT